MKKSILIIIAFLFSTIGNAKFLKAVLYLEDGTKKSGFAELVEMGDSKVSFRAEEKSKTEKLISADIKKIEYSDDKGNQYITERLFLTTVNNSGKASKSKEKKWIFIVYEKAIKIGVIGTAGNSRVGTNGTTIVNSFPDASYFFGTTSTDELFFGLYVSGAALSVNTAGGTDKLMKKMAKSAFPNCQKLIDATEKEEFKTKTAADQMIALAEKIKCK